MTFAHQWRPAQNVGRYRPDGVIGTPFHDRTAYSSSSQWIWNWDLYHVPAAYSDPYEELRSIRHTVAITDQSPLTKCSIIGPDASAFVDQIFTSDTSSLKVGSILYSVLCNEDGKLITDGLLFREGESSFRFTGEPMIEWLRQRSSPFSVEINDETDAYGILAVQGPLSQIVLGELTGEDWSDLGFSRLRRTVIAGIEIEVARQGFTGELGYELLAPAESAKSIWDAVMSTGEEHSIRACGHIAVDMARVEAGLVIPGPDFANAGPDPVGSHTPCATDRALFASPFEMGMERLVDLHKHDFVGRSALIAQQEAGVRSTLVGLELDWRRLVDGHFYHGVPPDISRVSWMPKQVTVDSETVGRATSATWGPSVKKLIAFGHLDRRFSMTGTEVAVAWPIPGDETTIEIGATVRELPFFSLRRA